MKYKWIGLAACALMIILAILAPLSFAGHDKIERVHQHRQPTPTGVCTDQNDGGLCTYLPIVQIDTHGTVIPGRPVYGRNGEVSYTMAADGSSTISADLQVIGSDCSVYHHANAAPDVVSRIQIRIRGNSSRSFDKPSYAIRLVDDSGVNAPQSIMGMDAHHEWVLYGPWLDKTAVRNYMFYNLSGEIMSYAPNVRYCELILNGEYQGLYLMTESITGGSNGARLQLSVSAKRNEFTGYLLRLDHNRPEETSLNSFTTYTCTTPLLLQVEYPGGKKLTPEMQEAIRQDFSDFEKSLYSFDYDMPIFGYKDQIDVDSFVSYFIINELSSNADAGNYSTYNL